MEIHDKFPSIERTEITFLSPSEISKITSNISGKNEKNLFNNS